MANNESAIDQVQQRDKRIQAALLKAVVLPGFVAGVAFGFFLAENDPMQLLILGSLSGVCGALLGFLVKMLLTEVFRLFLFGNKIRNELDRREREAARRELEQMRAADKERKKKEAEEKEARQRDVESGILLIDVQDRPAIRFDPSTEELTFYSESGGASKSYGADDLVSVEIIDDGGSIIKTDRGSQLAGALVGGAVMGGLGAAIGGLSGSKTQTGRCEHLALKIVVQDMNNPTHVVTLLRRTWLMKDGWQRNGYSYKSALHQAEHWHGKISVLMKKAEAAERAPAGAVSSLATELEQLKKLHEQGDLTEQEYARARARVLDE